jgi:hypothetical protein
MSNKWTTASVTYTYHGVEEELGHILTPFFVALVQLFFCMFVDFLAGSGIGKTNSRVLLVVAVAVGIVNVGVLGIEANIEGTGSTSSYHF